MNRLLLRIDAVARQSVPVALTLLLVLISALPPVLPVFREAAPAWVLIAVFHWSVQRPELMPVQAAFVIGLLQDLLLGLPPGSSALIYVVLRGVAGRIAQLTAGRGFVNLWIMFAGAAAGAGLLRYLIMTVWLERVLDPVPALFELLLTVGVFPLVSWLLTRLQRGLLTHA
ncbi:MAG: rod shape-determining protein MreD [Alphaproteobacteria bacterium]